MTEAEILAGVRLAEGDRAGGGERAWSGRWKRLAIIFAGWTMIAFFFAGQFYYSRLLSPRPLTWREAAAPQFLYSYLWALGSFLVLWLAERFPVEGRLWRRNVPVHLLCATALVVVISGVFHIIYFFLLIKSPDRHYDPATTVGWIIY